MTIDLSIPSNQANIRRYLTDPSIDISYQGKEVLYAYKNNNQLYPPPPTPPSAGNYLTPLPNQDLLFDANFAQGFSQYKNPLPLSLEAGVDYGTSIDPLGSNSIVAWVDSHRSLTHGNAHPRSEMEAPYFIKPAVHGNTKSVYAHYGELYFPENNPMTATSDWTLLFEFHGTPYIGPSAAGLMLVYNVNSKTHYLRMGNDPKLLGTTNPIFPIGQWVGVIVYQKYEYASNGGFVQLLINTSETRDKNWRTIPVNSLTRAPLDLISDEEGNGFYNDPTLPPASARFGRYGSHKGRWYVKNHRIGYTLKSVLPPTWDTLVDNTPFSEAT